MYTKETKKSSIKTYFLQNEYWGWLDNDFKQLYNKSMIIYYYEKSLQLVEGTDALIAKSLSAYGKERGLSLKEPIKILRTEKGKPYVLSEGLFIGVTHTESLVLIAIASSNFGIDVERNDRPLSQMDRLLTRLYSQREQETVLGQKEAAQKQCFLALWTKKEAFLKCLGTGLKDLKQADTFGVEGSFYTIERGAYLITVYAKQPIDRIEERNAEMICFE